ncbi:ABC transporter substrate-binding protein [Williamsia sp. 1138]|uniref:ABC transporter substrate-binding protein n=1 Tax=Williamsia sp. 1138 TaxID=1903117 RepID=UPI001FEF790C|nr:ABC transporter substrate-binding protein [Williamsia sp. 1138]
MRIKNPRRATARAAMVTATVAALIGITACSAPDEDSTGASVTAEEGALPVTVTHNFGETEIKTEPARIATLGPGDADILMALGITPTTIVPFNDPTGKNVIEPWNEKYIAENTPVALGQATQNLGADIPKALATNPDFVVAVNNAVTREQYDNLTKVAPTIVREAQYQDWLIPWAASTKEIGTAVGMPDETQELIDQTNAKFDEAKAQYPNMVGKKSAVIISGADGSISIYGPGDGRGQMLVNLGQVFPAELEPLVTSGFYGTISNENLNLLNNLDQVVAIDWEGSNEKLKNNAIFNNLDIAKRGGVIYLDQQIGSAMSVPTVLTIPWAIDQIAPKLGA